MPKHFALSCSLGIAAYAQTWKKASLARQLQYQYQYQAAFLVWAAPHKPVLFGHCLDLGELLNMH